MSLSSIQRATNFFHKAVNKGKAILETLADKAATAAKDLEGSTSSGVSLDGFTRHIQLDRYSCGAKCTFAILKYYKKARSIRNVTKQLGTDTEGTDAKQIRSLLRDRGLQPVVLKRPTIKSLKKQIDCGYPIIVSMDTDHWAVVYGYGDGYLMLMDPSLGRTILCKQNTGKFR